LSHLNSTGIYCLQIFIPVSVIAEHPSSAGCATAYLAIRKLAAHHARRPDMRVITKKIHLELLHTVHFLPPIQTCSFGRPSTYSFHRLELGLFFTASIPTSLSIILAHR
jgi:hypothetical protein